MGSPSLIRVIRVAWARSPVRGMRTHAIPARPDAVPTPSNGGCLWSPCPSPIRVILGHVTRKGDLSGRIPRTRVYGSAILGDLARAGTLPRQSDERDGMTASERIREAREAQARAIVQDPNAVLALTASERIRIARAQREYERATYAAQVLAGTRS